MNDLNHTHHYFLTFITAILIALFLSACSHRENSSGFKATEVINYNTVYTDQERSDASKAIRALADDVWADMLANWTYFRMQEGLPIDQFEDLTLESHRMQLKQIAGYRSRLNSIKRDALTGDDLITYEILSFQSQQDGTNDDDYWLIFDITPYQAPRLFNLAIQALQSQTLTTELEAQHYLKLSGELADMIDQLIAKLEGQMERGIYLPKSALPSTRLTWQGLQKNLVASIRVDSRRLKTLSLEKQTRFKASLDQLIKGRIEKGFKRLLSSLGENYETHAPESVGLSQYPNGQEVYKRLVRKMTTLDLTPEEIHMRGKAAVRDIAMRMKSIRDQVGFSGTAKEFLLQLKANTNYIAANPAEVEQRFIGYIDRIEPKLNDYFKTIPKAPYAVKRLPLEAEAGMTYGYYEPPNDAQPVGYYYYNASNLPERSMIWAASLIYHELLPGHHFHIATQAENEALQKFRQNTFDTAYTEGWAEYAASLGIEMGLYQTPEELYGRYVGEMFLATRLVVDTGMNGLGWSLQDARSYMSQHVIQSESEIASETLRYSTSIPAQALAYRIGYEKLWELRKKAESTLGSKFNIRDFHRTVLADGSMPLAVLESKVERYITREHP